MMWWRFVWTICVGCLLGTISGWAQEPPPQQSTTGPTPPPGAVELQGEVIVPSTSQVISDVPAYLWRHGCGPTAVGMVIGYYALHGFPDLIAGNVSTQSTAVNQAIASQGSGVRGTGLQLHYEDYALPNDTGQPAVLSDSSTNYPAGCHTNNCIADFMRTSWSSAHNYYGWSWSSDITPAFQNYVAYCNSNYIKAGVLYSLNNNLWQVLTNEISHNRPMVFLVDSSGDGSTDHFVPVVGFSDDPTQQYCCLNTWDKSLHWYTFRAMSNSYSWGVWGGWSFNLQQPPIVITHTSLTNTGNAVTSYVVQAQITPTNFLNTNAVRVLWNTNGSAGAFNTNALTWVSNTLYRGSIPAQPAGVTVFYYLHAENTTSNVTTCPSNAPSALNSFQVIGRVDIPALTGWCLAVLGGLLLVIAFRRIATAVDM